LQNRNINFYISHFKLYISYLNLTRFQNIKLIEFQFSLIYWIILCNLHNSTHFLFFEWYFEKYNFGLNFQVKTSKISISIRKTSRFIIFNVFLKKISITLLSILLVHHSSVVKEGLNLFLKNGLKIAIFIHLQIGRFLNFSMKIK